MCGVLGVDHVVKVFDSSFSSFRCGDEPCGEFRPRTMQAMLVVGVWRNDMFSGADSMESEG